MFAPNTGCEFHFCTGCPGVGTLSFALRYAGLLSYFCDSRLYAPSGRALYFVKERVELEKELVRPRLGLGRGSVKSLMFDQFCALTYVGDRL